LHLPTNQEENGVRGRIERSAPRRQVALIQEKEVALMPPASCSRDASGRACNLRWVLAAGIAFASAGLVGAAAGEADSARAAKPAKGAVYGGFTPQDWPVVIEVSKDRRRVVRAMLGMTLTCTPSGATVRIPDEYRNLPLSRSGRFDASFENPVTESDGTITDLRGSMTGTTSSKRTKMSGTWQFTAVEHDAAGAVTDTCDSGRMAWTAKQ
jgi:hypothetical protein